MWYMNEEREMLQKMVRDFTKKEIVPFIKVMEETHEFPHDIIKKAGEIGITGLIIPEVCGGIGPKWVEFGICLEEIGKESNCITNALSSQFAGTSLLTTLGNQRINEEIIAPIARGDFIMATAQCEPAGQTMQPYYKCHFDWSENGDLVLNGSKIFCTNAGEAEWYLVNVKTAKPYEPPMGEFSYVLVHKDTPGFRVGHIEKKIGWNGSSTGQLYFENCRVPKKNLVLSMDLNPEMSYMGGGGIAVLVAAGALGSAEGVYEKALAYSRERMHGDRSLFDSYQAMRFTFAELKMEIEKLRNMVYAALTEMDAKDPDAIAHGWMCKLQGAKIFEHVASECITLCGGNGIIVENGFERYLRDAKVNSIACFALPHVQEFISTHLM